MPEKLNDKTVFSLLEVTQSIQRTLAERYKSIFWVKAEMNKLNHYSHSGHCYPELVEKTDGKVIALLKATLWKDDYIRINNHFLNVLKEPLKNGIKILFCAKIMFDPVHGLSLRILDIDVAYTLGDLEREKYESIEKLKAEGLWDCNKQLMLPLLPQRIAIISVETSKGYADFLKVIDGNPWRYKFFHCLFPALLQGERAIESIAYQLERIKKVRKHFDVVAIVRGGGGDVGLSCYNHYHLAKAIAQFPLPVITGIGHATNETVTEMVAFENAITPTKLAEFLLQQFHNFSTPVEKAYEKIISKSTRIIREEKLKLHGSLRYFRSASRNIVHKNNSAIQQQWRTLLQRYNVLLKNEKEVQSAFVEKIKKESLSFLNRANVVIKNAERSVDMMDPKNVLKRGYSIALLKGKSIKTFNEVKEGDEVNVVLSQGSIISKVTTVNKPNDQ